jgi:hypothetical protein
VDHPDDGVGVEVECHGSGFAGGGLDGVDSGPVEPPPSLGGRNHETVVC